MAAALVLGLTLVPTAALAAEYVEGDVKTMSIAYQGCTHDLYGGVQGMEDHCHDFMVDGFGSGAAQVRSGPNWSYEPASYTLTLNNFHGTAIYIQGEYAGLFDKKTPTVTIKLVGENSLTGNGKQMQAALHAAAADVVIEGPGSLSISGEKNGITVTTNNGDYKAGTFDGGALTLKNGASIHVDGLVEGGSALQSDQLIITSGCSVNLVSANSFGAGYTNNLVVNGTLVSRRTTAGNYGLPFQSGMYCTVGSNVTIKAGQGAATANTVLTTGSPQTSPIYGDVTILRYEFDKTHDYVEFREGGAAAPEVPTTPAVNIAYARTQTITVDGKPVEFQTYAIKDGKGNETNYVKLRDLAYVLNGTSSQFNVGWDGSVVLETGEAYISNGSEMTTPFSGDRPYTISTAATKFSHSDIPLDLTAIVLKDDKGAGYTYYKLRDLGITMGFEVGWSAEKGIYMNTPVYG